MQRNNLQKHWSGVQSATNQITVWDTGMYTNSNPSPQMVPPSCAKFNCAGCPIDVLKWIGAKSVAIPENLVSVPKNHTLDFLSSLLLLFIHIAAQQSSPAELGQ